MGVSTFAWYQAQAAVNIEATPSETQITVSAPDDVSVEATLYYYSGNNYDNTNLKGYKGTPSMSYSDFSNEADSSAKKSLSDLYPGYKMSFMIEVVSTQNIGTISLQITNFTSSNAGVSTNRYDVTGRTSLDHPITLANAIRMYVGATSSTAAVPTITSGTNKFTYGSPSASGTYNLANGIGSSLTTTAYLYYTVYFDDTENANKFLEYKQAAKTELMDTTPNDNNNRFFKQDNSGDSNCFEGLSFSIPKLKITVGGLS